VSDEAFCGWSESEQKTVANCMHAAELLASADAFSINPFTWMELMAAR
jgi:hypothetical protein